MDKRQVLKDTFGYDIFRPGQEALIDAILAGRDALGVMPTGAGKSLCFQVPALLLEGTTIVVSPLISLMKDQVGALRENGVPAAFINSTLNQYDFFDTLDGLRAGYYKLLYVAPERLDVESFLQCLGQVRVPLVTIDEAHCVSQWGQDFRPGYLKIRAFIDSFAARPAVAAFTATATRQVSEDIVRLLGLDAPEVVATGFDRGNLYFSVEQPKDKMAALSRYVRERAGMSGIVYCSTRKGVEEVCAGLIADGCGATRYHAGLSEEERRRSQDDFLYDRCPLMVATNAFGMGIDKSNVSFVVHYNMPKDVESYYQEAGRAGRDGSPAECVLYYSGRDVRTNQFLIENSGEDTELDAGALEEVRRKSRERLKRMTWYCHTDDCLRAYILMYFGETPPPRCENCSNCRRRFTEEDITIEAQKILSCVRRAGERFGAKAIVDILRGSESEKMRVWRFNELSTYGIMKGDSAARVRAIIDFLVLSGYLRATDEKYPVLRLTAQAGGILFHGERLAMKTPEQRPGREGDRQKEKEKTAPENPALFDRLRRLRARIASAESIPAYMVFSDATLRGLSGQVPRSSEEMLEVPGVGKYKLERYGTVFLTEIGLYLDEM